MKIFNWIFELKIVPSFSSYCVRACACELIVVFDGFHFWWITTISYFKQTYLEFGLCFLCLFVNASCEIGKQIISLVVDCVSTSKIRNFCWWWRWRWQWCHSPKTVTRKSFQIPVSIRIAILDVCIITKCSSQTFMACTQIRRLEPIEIAKYYEWNRRKSIKSSRKHR